MNILNEDEWYEIITKYKKLPYLDYKKLGPISDLTYENHRRNLAKFIILILKGELHENKL